MRTTVPKSPVKTDWIRLGLVAVAAIGTMIGQVVIVLVAGRDGTVSATEVSAIAVSSAVAVVSTSAVFTAIVGEITDRRRSR